MVTRVQISTKIHADVGFPHVGNTCAFISAWKSMTGSRLVLVLLYSHVSRIASMTIPYQNPKKGTSLR